jgi:FkbM family methyltransferase
VIDFSRKLYRKIAGEDAFLAHLPLALMRTVRGDHVTVLVGTKLLTVDLRDDVIAFHLVFRRTWEPNETALVERIVRPGDRVVDIGANIGYYSTLCGGIVGAGGCVLAIEADPANAALCEKNLTQNGLDGTVSVVRAAAGPAGASALLYASPNNFGAHTLVKPDREAQTIRVDVVPVDELVAAWPRVDFIKIDVEGYEPYVFEGLRETIARCPDIKILCEFDPSYILRAGRDPFAFLAELAALGFAFFDVGRGGVATETSIPQLRAALEGTRDAKNLLLRRAR